jgi:iron complex outermembrane receptor protein
MCRAVTGPSPGARAISTLARIAAFASIIALSAPCAAQAQQSAAQTGQPEAATGQATGLQEIVVTAQRREERLVDVPFTLAAMSGEDLKRQNVTSTRDLTAAFPGLVFTTQGSDAEPTIRGVSTQVSTPGAGPPVAIYVDGLYQASEEGNQFDLPDVQQIQVLKGPQGTLYGRNATGGAILITTLQPSFTPTGSITVGDGAFFGGSAKTSNHFQAQGFLSGPLVADKLAASLTAAYEEAPGYLTNDLTGGRFGKIEDEFVRAKLLFKATDDLRILLAGSYSSNRDDAQATRFPLRTVASLYPGAVVPTQVWHTASEQPGGGAYMKNTHADESLTVDWTLPGAGTLTSRTGYTQVQPLLNTDVGDAYSPGCRAAFVCNTPVVVWQPDYAFQQDINFASEKFGHFSFVSGAFYLHDKEALPLNVSPDITPPFNKPYGPYGYFVFDEHVRTKAFAVYFEGTYDITDALTAIAGVRYSDETKVEYARQSLFTFAAPTGPYLKLPPEGPPTDVAWTPKVALRYALDTSTNVFVSYNRGFKSSVLTGLSLTGPAAKPETIDSFETGIKHSGERISYNASTFFYKYKDLQEEFFNGLTTLTTNAASAKSYGFDLDGTVRVTDGFKLQAGLSWIPYAKYTSFPNGVDFTPPLMPAGMQQVIVDATGQRLLRDPKYTASITADYSRDIAWGNLDASATAYSSASYDWDLLRRVQTGAYTTLGGQISLIPRGSSFKYSLYGKNLTNKAYITGFVGGATADEVNLSQPREVGLRANYSF